VFENSIPQIRACLKINSCHLHAPLCGIFSPNSGYIARYAPFIRDKSPTNWDAKLSESNFKTCSGTQSCQKAILKHALVRKAVRKHFSNML